ncbi:MAG: PAS domain S-box protein, partial [Phycisphaerae bacterium]
YRSGEDSPLPDNIHARLFDAVPEAVFLCDADGVILQANAPAERLYGVDRQRLIGTRLEELVDEDHRHYTECGLRSVASGRAFQAESLHLRGDGEAFPAEELTSPLRMNGRVFAVTVVRDISARKNYEAELLETRRRYRTMYNRAHVGYFRTDLSDGSLMENNDQLARMFGYDGSDDIDDRRVPWLHCVNPNAYQTVVDALAEDGELAGREIEYFRRDGSIAWARMWTRSVPDKGYIECVLADMTDEKLALQALRRERDFAQRLLENAHAVVVVLGLTGRILRINRHARELTGLEESDLLGKDWFEVFLPADQRREVRQIFQHVVGGRESVSTERPLMLPGGELTVQWYASALRDEDAKPVGLMVIGHDITELQGRADQLRDAAKMEAVGRLAGGIAHDFNNQLTVIKGYGDLLLRRFGDQEDIARPMKQIVAAAGQASTLTHELLTFSRQQALHPRVVDVNRLLRDLREPIRCMMGEDVSLSMELGEDVAAVRVDPVEFEQAMVNVAANARDAMPDGGMLLFSTDNVEITEGAGDLPSDVPPGEYVRIAVVDSGVGMSEETVEQMFEPFFTTKPEGAGTGMGLASAYGFVKQSGGGIRVLSSPGKGTQFEVYLPQVDQRDLAESVGDQPPVPDGEGQTILVAEDSEAVRQIVVRILRESGYCVLEAANAAEAKEIAQRQEGQIDLLVTDVVMPGQNGVELAGELKETRPEMPVLYISGYLGETLSHRGLDTEEHNLLRKPFEAADLTRAVNRLLEVASDS